MRRLGVAIANGMVAASTENRQLTAPAAARKLKTMILKPGEKIHVIHRRYFEKETRRHFVGIVEDYEGGVARASGYVYGLDRVKFTFVRRPELRTRIIALASGDVLVNVIPDHVNLAAIEYKIVKKNLRVTDGSDWYLDLSEVTWL